MDPRVLDLFYKFIDAAQEFQRSNPDVAVDAENNRITVPDKNNPKKKYVVRIYSMREATEAKDMD
jgi:hypothetical protein